VQRGRGGKEGKAKTWQWLLMVVFCEIFMLIHYIYG
jgi:hypothetical protein